LVESKGGSCVFDGAGHDHAAETTISDKTAADKIDLIISEFPLFGATARSILI
jgi:hypothetical protein